MLGSRLVVVLWAGLVSVVAIGPGSAQAMVVYTYTLVDYPGASQTGCRSGINDRETIVGWFDGHFHHHAFVWSGGLFTTTFDYPRASDTFANGINNQGDIVGSFLDPDLSQEGFLLHAGVFTRIDPGFPGEHEVIGERGRVPADAALRAHRPWAWTERGHEQ